MLFPHLRQDWQYLFFTRSVTVTDEMEFCGRTLCPLQNKYPQDLPAWRGSLVGKGTPSWWWGTGLGSPSLTPLQLQPWEEMAMKGRKQKYLSLLLLPSTAEPHSSPGRSVHQAESVGASKALHWFLHAKSTCCLAADHGIYSGEVHSFCGPQNSSQGPPNPVRHLFPRWALGAFW